MSHEEIYLLREWPIFDMIKILIHDFLIVFLCSFDAAPSWNLEAKWFRRGIDTEKWLEKSWREEIQSFLFSQKSLSGSDFGREVGEYIFISSSRIGSGMIGAATDDSEEFFARKYRWEIF